MMDISKLISERKTEDECYKAGFDCGANGPNEENCRFTLFATPEKTARWEEGKADGEKVTG